MHILSIDAATKVMGVAVAQPEKLIAVANLNVGKTHSQRLLPLLADLLKAGNLELATIDLVAVTVGPGSFTGLRIGIATAKAIAQALGKKIVPVRTLDALAFGATGYGQLICPILDARKNEVYYGVYGADGVALEPINSMEPMALAAYLQATYLQDGTTKIGFLGDGADVYFGKIQEVLGEQAVLLPAAKRMFMADAAAFWALEHQEKAVLPWEIKAFYLRISEAEAKRKATIKGELG